MITLSMITKNSATKLSRAPISLRDVLDSTLQLPWKLLILVDDSSDNTREVIAYWCREHNKELFFTRSKLYGFHRPTRATARQTAIDYFFEISNDPWLMFLDDDVVLADGWWTEATKYIDIPRIGLIWGINWDSTPERREWLKLFGVDYKQYLIDEFLRRGGTHDTMIRREALEGIFIPPELHVFEDWYILRHVLDKGFDIAIVEKGCIHYNPWGCDLPREELRWMACLAKKYGIDVGSRLYYLKRFLRTFAGLPLNIIYSIKAFGFRRGLVRGWKRWRTKLLYRWYLLTT